MVNHKHNFIFIHIPKTAGEALSKALDIDVQTHKYTFRLEKEIMDKHETITEYMSLNQNNIDYFKFAFVRNPWDRAVSLWSYYLKRNIKPVSDNDFETCIKNFETLFCEVPAKYYSNSQRKVNLLYPQYHFISDWYGNNMLDYIGRFETLQEDFNIVCDKIGIPPQELPHTNQSNHKHYTEYYDDKTRAIISQKYAKDIEYFRYRFGD